MNRGSALKWVTALRKTKASYDPGQLRFNANGVLYMSAFGVLCDMINPDSWKLEYDGVSYSFEGLIFEPPRRILSSCKIRKDYFKEKLVFKNPLKSNYNGLTFNQIENFATEHRYVADFIEEVYEQL